MPGPHAAPTSTETSDIARLLEAWNHGEERALDRLIPVVYAELHRLAYLRRVDYRHPRWQYRTHFFGAAAHLMQVMNLSLSAIKREWSSAKAWLYYHLRD